MKAEDLGYNSYYEKMGKPENFHEFETGRITAEYKERYTVMTINGDYEAEITGNMRFTARNREDFPAVGDWVYVTVYDSDLAIIHKIFPRFSVIKRQAVGQFGEVQIIAANIDYAFLVQAVDRDFNINRLERYLTICHSSRVKPIIILTKIDLINEDRLTEILNHIKARIDDIPIIPVSNQNKEGYDILQKNIQRGKTYCLLGSSGVGKSTILNNLSGRVLMKTGEISHSTDKGRHITSHRELIILENGGILIDNPGMREVGIADTESGLEDTFGKIFQFAEKCKYRDCTHINESGCAVLEALEKGDIEKGSYENYLKIQKEKAHFESTITERKKKEKQLGKIVKNYKKIMNKINSNKDN